MFIPGGERLPLAGGAHGDDAVNRLAFATLLEAEAVEPGGRAPGGERVARADCIDNRHDVRRSGCLGAVNPRGCAERAPLHDDLGDSGVDELCHRGTVAPVATSDSSATSRGLFP